MARVFNFSSGPAMLPGPVLQEAQQGYLDWHGRGCMVGGMRVSIYQAMLLAGVRALVDGMRDFGHRHG